MHTISPLWHSVSLYCSQLHPNLVHLHFSNFPLNSACISPFQLTSLFQITNHPSPQHRWCHPRSQFLLLGNADRDQEASHQRGQTSLSHPRQTSSTSYHLCPFIFLSSICSSSLFAIFLKDSNLSKLRLSVLLYPYSTSESLVSCKMMLRYKVLSRNYILAFMTFMTRERRQ